jgi:uncharacterized protein (DUF488 family)
MCVEDENMTIIYSLGYEGTDVQQFIRTLLRAGVKVVADVRAVPLSRKKGFSKRRLSECLASAGIDYLHFVDLGNPREGREAAKAGNTTKFHRVYLKHLSTTFARTALNKLAELAASRATCLLCFEREPTECHRTLVASSLSTYGIDRVDLFTDSSGQNVQINGVVRGRHLSQGAAAAE